MRKRLSKLLTVLIIAICLIYTVLLIFSINEFQAGSFDVNIQSLILILLLFCLVIYSVFLVKGIFNRFNNLRNNYILLISNVLSIIILSIFIYYVAGAFHTIFGGWSAYPPLSAQPDSAVFEIRDKYAGSILYLWTIQFILLITLVIAGTETGKLLADKIQDDGIL